MSWENWRSREASNRGEQTFHFYLAVMVWEKYNLRLLQSKGCWRKDVAERFCSQERPDKAEIYAADVSRLDFGHAPFILSRRLLFRYRLGKRG